MSDRWTFLTTHAHVILAIARNPDLLVREIAEEVGVTERTVTLALSDLERDGYVARSKVGRRNHYAVLDHRPLRHRMNEAIDVDELLALLGPDS